MASISWDNLAPGDYQPADWVDFGGGGTTGDKWTVFDPPPSNDVNGRVSTPGVPVATAPTTPTYTTGAGWGDPYNAAQPQDPYYSLFQSLNPSSPAAQASPVGMQYRPNGSAPAATSGGGRTAESIVDDWFANQNIRGHQDKNVWVNYLKNANGGLTDANVNYFLGRFLEDPNNNPHTGETFGGGPSGPPTPNASAFGYDDPSSLLYLTQALQRLSSLNQQQQQIDPFQQLLQIFGLNRVGDLSGAPYTAGEDAALRTRYLEPLTQARDAALRQNKERVGARGMLPTSGLLDALNRGTNADYQKAVGSAANDTAIQAINEKQRRGQEQLAILSSLLGVSRTAQDRNNALGKEAVTTAELFPLFDERRLDQLLRASGEGATSPTSALSALTGLGNLNLNAQQLNDRNSANSSAAWGQILGYILGAL
jgi:hypothetical protein